MKGLMQDHSLLISSVIRYAAANHGRRQIASRDPDGRFRDHLACEVEDFGLPENLMLWAEARRFFVIVTPDPFSDLTGLELALDAARVYATA